MFHPGKVLTVLRNDDKGVQAVVLMWDDNLLTVEVEPVLADKIKDNDVVLLDYSPKYQTIPVPKQVVVKILRGDVAKKVWNDYAEKVKKRKVESEGAEL